MFKDERASVPFPKWYSSLGTRAHEPVVTVGGVHATCAELCSAALLTFTSLEVVFGVGAGN